MMQNEKPKQAQPNNPLHGVKLKDIMEYLVKEQGWSFLASNVDVRCFKYDPSIKSSLVFLRKTPWARAKVEDLYLTVLQKKNAK